MLEHVDAERRSDGLARWQLPRDVPQQVALRQRSRQVAAGDGAEGQREHGCRDLRVDRLVRLDLAITEIEERLPADEPARRPTPSAQVGGIGVAILVGVEHEGEERVAVVAGEVRRYDGRIMLGEGRSTDGRHPITGHGDVDAEAPRLISKHVVEREGGTGRGHSIKRDHQLISDSAYH